MRSKPIIMSTYAVKCILEGRKIQARRVIKPQPVNTWGSYWEWQLPKKTLPFHKGMVANKFAQSGDRRWVQETWRVADGKEYTLTAPEWEGGQNQSHIEYKANDPHPENVKWKPSIHMPKWASRITLEIMNVRVERLDNITRDDAQREGMIGFSAREQFMDIWEKLNGNHGINPFVWVIDFKIQAEKLGNKTQIVKVIPIRQGGENNR